MKNLILKKPMVVVTLISFLFGTIIPQAYASPGSCKYCSGYSYNGAVGTGDGICGRCENVVKTWTIGSCASGTTGSCDDSQEYYTVTTDMYLCDASDWEIAAGVALTAACGALLGGGAALCALKCVTPPWVDCIACWLALGAVEGTCACTIGELFCPCTFSHSENSQQQAGCIS